MRAFLYEANYIHAGHMMSRENHFLVTPAANMADAAGVCPTLKNHAYRLDGLQRIDWVDVRIPVTEIASVLYLYLVRYQRGGGESQKRYVALEGKQMEAAVDYARLATPKYDEISSISYLGMCDYRPFNKEETHHEETSV